MRASLRLRLAFTSIVTAMLAGCAGEPVVMETRAPAPMVGARKISRPIAFVHPSEFVNQQLTIEPYGNRYYLPLNIGEASDRDLRIAYQHMFTAAREVIARDQLSRLAGPDALQAVLEPSITGLKYLNASLRMEGPFYAEIRYRFRLTAVDGADIAQWTVRGHGRYPTDADHQPRTKDSPPAPRSEQGIVAEAPRRAVEDGVAAFARSFDRVPELIRWARNEPVLDVNVPLDKQITKEAAAGSSVVDAMYPDAFTLQAERTALPRPPKAAAEEGGPEPPLVAVRVNLRNDSGHRLALDPGDIEWDAGLERSIEPLPPTVAAALVTRLPFGIAVAPGIGPAALPALIAALVSASELARHQAEYSSWIAAVTAETLADGVADPRGTRSGLVYFPRPAKAASGTLVLRVIDLDAALRYTVRVPIAGV